MNTLSAIKTFFFIILTTSSSWGLPGEGLEVEQPVYQDGKTFTMEQVRDAAKEHRQIAEAVCSGKREGIVNEQLQKLMNVGLYNYCDQYSDEAKFCGCVKEASYDKKLSDQDLENWHQNLIEMSKRNISLNSFKVLKDYKEDVIKEISNLPFTINYGKYPEGAGVKSCNNSHALMDALAPTCGEKELVSMKEHLALALKDCESCTNMDLSLIPKSGEGRDERTSGEEFLFFPGFLVQEEHSRKVVNGDFSLEQISKSKASNTRYKSKGDLQYKVILEDIASKIHDTYRGRPIRRFGFGRVSDIEKTKNAAFVLHMNNHFILKDLPDLPRESSRYATGKVLAGIVADYIDAIKLKIPSGIFNKSELSKEDIAKELEKYFIRERVKFLAKKCEKVVEVMKMSCSAMSNKNHQLSFNLDKDSAEKVRNREYSNDKFKFDQLYCATKSKSKKSKLNYITAKFFKNPNEELRKLSQNSKNLFDTNLLSLEQGHLNDIDFSPGVSNDLSVSLLRGRKSLDTEVALMGTEVLEGIVKGMTNDNLTDYYNDTSSFIKSNQKVDSLVPPLIASPSPFQSASDEDEDEDDIALPLTNSEASEILIESTVSSSKKAKSTSVRPDDGFRDIGNVSSPKINELLKIEAPKLPMPTEVEIPTLEKPLVEESISIEVSEKTEIAELNKEHMEGLDKIPNDNLMKENIAKNEEVLSNPTGENFGTLPENVNMNFNRNKSNFQSQASAFNSMNKVGATKELTNEEILEQRIKELEGQLSSNNIVNETKSSEVANKLNPTKNSFSKSEEDPDENLELNELKVELEKMKLQMAKSELEAKKKEQAEKSVAANKAQTQLPSSAPPANSELSPLARATANSSIQASNSKRSTSVASPSSSSSSSSSTVQSRSEASLPANSQVASPITTEVASAKALPSSTNRKASTGALLSATEIGESSFIGSASNNVVSYDNFSDISTAGQSELEKLYNEYGAEVITKGGIEVTLEKDEATGEIKAVEKPKRSVAESAKKKTIKRAPASTTKQAKDRKRFSLQEFNKIIDNGVKKE